ncbi:MAG: helix-turn-helix transcriptional regulator [Rhizobiales bacterium]|nr:helix-turn-helix transcriptional regulator [Hyphomicrobiales bacterium]
MPTQKITTPGGDTLVVLPIEEYQDLLDAVDAADADQVRRNIESGNGEYIPSELVNRLVNGESPIRVWREYRGLTAKDLAIKAGISQPYLSGIETGKREGRVSTLKAIAEVLKVELDDLV